MQIQTFNSWEKMAEGADDWLDLARWASEPNPSLEPFYLLPAWKHLESERTRGVVVKDEDGRWAGLWVVSRPKGLLDSWRRGSSGWEHGHDFLGTPLVRQGKEGLFWQGMLDWFARDPRSGLWLRGGNFRLDGPIWVALQQIADERRVPVWVAKEWTRGLLQTGEPSEDYLKSVLTSHRRKRLLKLEQRLAALGDVRYECLEQGDSLEDWVEIFLRLEHGGWKGAEGTSLRAKSQHERFFRETCAGAWRSGGLRMVRLMVGERTVAMICDFKRGGAGFSFKVACDDTLRDSGPGLCLDLWNVRKILDEASLQWVDSCAAPDQAAVNSLWRERRRLGMIYVARPTWLGRLSMRLRMKVHRLHAARQESLPQEKPTRKPQTEASTEAPCKLRQRETTLW